MTTSDKENPGSDNIATKPPEDSQQSPDKPKPYPLRVVPFSEDKPCDAITIELPINEDGD
jgi:hypothetical protein